MYLNILGATIHLSGVDMIDGTPVLDIKPYIPEYDQPPTFHKADPPSKIRKDTKSHQENNNVNTVPLLANQTQQDLNDYYSSTKRYVTRENGVLDGVASRTRSASPYDRRQYTGYLLKRQAELQALHTDSSSSDSLCNDKVPVDEKDTARPSRRLIDDSVRKKSLTLYFYDSKEQGEDNKSSGKYSKLLRSITDTPVGSNSVNVNREKRNSDGYVTSDTSRDTSMSDSMMSCSITSTEMDSDSMTSSVSSKHDKSDVTLQQLSSQSEASDGEEKPVSQRSRLPKPEPRNTGSSQAVKSSLFRRSLGDVVRIESSGRTRSLSPYERRSYHGEEIKTLTDPSELIKALRQGNELNRSKEKLSESSKSNAISSDVSGASKPQQVTTASWISSPPIATGLNVKFTSEAESQLQCFSSKANDVGYMLAYLTDPEDARTAIVDILKEDPRSAYRRKKCKDSLYYFTVDNIHVTCWFDDETQSVEVVKVRPVLSAEQLKQKK